MARWKSDTGSSLNGGTVLCPWAIYYRCFILVATKENDLWFTKRLPVLHNSEIKKKIANLITYCQYV